MKILNKCISKLIYNIPYDFKTLKMKQNNKKYYKSLKSKIFDTKQKKSMIY
jgi:hypothetical protein